MWWNIVAVFFLHTLLCTDRCCQFVTQSRDTVDQTLTFRTQYPTSKSQMNFQIKLLLQYHLKRPTYSHYQSDYYIAIIVVSNDLKLCVIISIAQTFWDRGRQNQGELLQWEHQEQRQWSLLPQNLPHTKKIQSDSKLHQARIHREPAPQICFSSSPPKKCNKHHFNNFNNYSVFENTCASTQKYVKSHVFGFWKYVKIRLKTYV